MVLCLIRKQVSLALIDLCKFVCCVFDLAIIFDTMAHLFNTILFFFLLAKKPGPKFQDLSSQATQYSGKTMETGRTAYMNGISELLGTE
jgi:hypothetical protein